MMLAVYHGLFWMFSKADINLEIHLSLSAVSASERTP